MKAATIKKQLSSVAIAKNNLAVKPNLTVIFIICFISIMFSGIASMLMMVYSPVVLKDLLGNVTNEKINNVSAYINSIFILGSMSGAFAWRFIAGKTGCSKAVILSTAVYGLFTILTAFSSSLLMVGVYRFATGFGVGGVILATNILIAELWPEKNRAIAVGVISSAMPAGFIAAGTMNNLFADWHYAFLTGVIPVITAIVAVFSLSEPGRKNNKKTSFNSRIASGKLFMPSYKKDHVKGPIIFGTMLIALWVVFSWAPAWIESIKGNASINNLHGLTMMILATSGLGGSIISGWLANTIGLRKTMMLCFAVSFIMTFMVFKLNTSIPAATFTEMGLLAFYFGISQGALAVYISSLFPEVTRASATGSRFNKGSLFTATIIFFTGALVSFLGGYGNAVFTFSFIFFTVLVAAYFSKYKPASGAVTFKTAFAE